MPIGATVIARGHGRSYGDQALNTGGRVLGMTRMDRYLGFDPETGHLSCEAGVSLAQVIRDFSPRGWFPMITPGTKHVTIGGCIANDVHGKGHYSQGAFNECVESMKMLTADGSVVACDRVTNADLFWATFGGLGLVGVVLEAVIRLRRIESTYFRQMAVVRRDLASLLDAFAEHDDAYPYSVAYIDPLAVGKDLGRGVLTVGDHARSDELPKQLRRAPITISSDARIDVPFELPSWTLNSATIRVLNEGIKALLAHAEPFAHYEKFFYPLDAISNWNRAYGRPGFTQYQFAVPFVDGYRHMRSILSAIVASDNLPFLNILKRFGPESKGMLSFPFDGFTLAIDFPVRHGTRELLQRLDAMVVECGGRVYLGKDAFLAPRTLRAMYPRLDEWRATKAKYDPDSVFVSDLARRLELV